MDIFSLEFLIFLASCFILYYLIFLLNKAFEKVVIPQWFVLLIGSLFFYGFTNWIYLAYLGGSSLISYLLAILCQYKLKDSKKRFIDSHLERKRYENLLCALAIVINVGVLATLKYFNFFSTSINSLFHLSLNTYRFINPLGISFYTFSLIAYNVDCCKRVTKAESNPAKFLLFVSYFPKVLQGPISSYDKLKEDGLFEQHSFIDVDYLKALFRISIGLVKKLVIANVLGLYVDKAYANLQTMFGFNLVIICVFYAIQLYCDFSGFMDISIGVSNLFGVKLEENFDVPYISSSIQEFWRRWHITLGNWLKKYIYIPLGGNRVPIWRWIINTLIVWLVSGIWHGANWTFVVWGLFHGILLVINGLPKQIQKRKGISGDKKKPNLVIKGLFIALTFILVNIGWIFFRADNIKDAARYGYHMIKVWHTSAYSPFVDTALVSYNWLLIVSSLMIVVLIAIKVAYLYKSKIIDKIKYPLWVNYVSKCALTIVFCSLAIFMFFYTKSINGGGSSFIYFDF